MKLSSRTVDEKPSIMIVPMIDIIFFLLVFFMLSMLTMVTQKTIALRLPQTTAAKIDTTKTIPISVDESGALYWERERISGDELPERLAAAKSQAGENEKLTIVLRGDVAAQYGQVVTVLDLIRLADIDRVSIATDGKSQP